MLISAAKDVFKMNVSPLLIASNSLIFQTLHYRKQCRNVFVPWWWNVSFHSRYYTFSISAIRINTTSGFWQDNHDFIPPPRRDWIRGSLNCQSSGLRGWSRWILNLSFSPFSCEIVRSLTSRSPTYIYILVFMRLLTREVDDTCVHTSNNLLVMGPRMHEQFIWTVLAHMMLVHPINSDTLPVRRYILRFSRSMTAKLLRPLLFRNW